MNKIYCTLLSILLSFSVLAQPKTYSSVMVDSSFGNCSFSDFAMRISEKKGFYVLYRADWVKNVQIPTIGKEMPIDDLLTRILSEKGLHYIYFQDNIVVMPGRQVGGASSVLNTVIIGDPLDEGKYRKAVVSGFVLDGKTESPISGAQIICEEQAKATSTDKTGRFSLELKTGRAHLAFHYMGLNSETADILLFSDGEMSIDLFEESINIDQINVLAERPADNYQSTSMGMTKINSREIKKLSVLMGEPDLIKSMIMLPGVQSVGENASGLNVRGGNADQNLILVQEAPIFNTSHLFGLFSMLDANIIDDVTFYKSGIPARYGGRTSSVMSIDLKKKMPSKFRVEGGLGLVNSRLLMEIPVVKDKLSVSLGGRTTYSDWMMGLVNDYDLKNSSAYFYDLNGKIDYKINKRQRITLFGYNSYDYFNYSGNAKYGYGNSLLSLKWQHVLSDNLSGVFNVNGSRYQSDLTDYSEQMNEYDLKSAIGQGQASYNMMYSGFSNHKLNAGLSAIIYNTEPGSAKPSNNESVFLEKDMDNENALEIAFSAEDEISISPKLSALAGFRYSHFLLFGPAKVRSYLTGSVLDASSVVDEKIFERGDVVSSYQGLEPRLSFKYEMGNSSSFKIGYNRMNQYVRQISNTASITPADYWKTCDSFIKPLISDQFAAGFFKNFRNDKYETSVEVYYKNLQNEVDFKNGAIIIMNDAIEQSLIYGRGRAYGAEFMVKKSMGRLSGWLSYTYSRSFKQMNGVHPEEQINNGKWYKSNYDKPHDFSAVLNYKISRRFTFSSNFIYSTGRPATFPEMKYQIGSTEVVYFSDRNKYRLPDYHRLDVAITYEGGLRKVQKWRSNWVFSIYNLYGRHNPFSVYYSRQQPSRFNNYNIYALYKFSIIGVPIPSFTYNFWF